MAADLVSVARSLIKWRGAASAGRAFRDATIEFSGNQIQKDNDDEWHT
jgi:hypothetical protein